jgi:hypothetical protein
MMHQRWFEPKERTTAKRTAKQRGVDVWKYTHKQREGGKRAGFYVGKTVPKVLRAGNITIESIKV